MSILAETQHKADAAPNKWAGRVKVGAVVPPWWQTESVIGVAEVSVAGAFTCLVHVARGRSGAWFANMPSAKRGDSWIPQFTIDDPDLEKEVARCAKVAVQAAQLTGSAATAQPDADPDSGDMPF